jgi:hypothetical protein
MSGHLGAGATASSSWRVGHSGPAAHGVSATAPLDVVAAHGTPASVGLNAGPI